MCEITSRHADVAATDVSARTLIPAHLGGSSTLKQISIGRSRSGSRFRPTRLEDPATLPAWVQRVTINTCLDALSRRKRQPATTSLTVGDEEGETRDYTNIRNPGATAEQSELRRCLERTLAKLDPEARKVIVLRDVEDMSYEEIAGLLKIGLSALKMRIHRARLAAQKLLEQICPGLASAAGIEIGGAAPRAE